MSTVEEHTVLTLGDSWDRTLGKVNQEFPEVQKFGVAQVAIHELFKIRRTASTLYSDGVLSLHRFNKIAETVDTEYKIAIEAYARDEEGLSRKWVANRLNAPLISMYRTIYRIPD